MKKQIVLFFFCLSMATISTAQTIRQHDSHAHGTGELNVVLDGNELAIELVSPAANIVGFEHVPSNDEQKAALVQVEQTLEQADELFVLPEQAGCQLEHVHVDSELLEEDHNDDNASEQDVDEHHDDEHAHRDEDEHEHEEDTHSEFHVEYEFRCDDIEKLSQIQVNLFDVFPATEQLSVQLLTPNQQTALTLNKENFNIDL